MRTVTLKFDTTDVETLADVLAILNFMLPYMVDNVEISWSEEE